MSWPLVKYVLTAALRDRLILTLMLGLIVVASLSVFLGSAAISEKEQFSIIYAGASIRMLGVMGIILFVVFFIRRSFEARDIEFLLSRPIGRIEFLMSYAMGLIIIAILMGLAQTAALYILNPHLFSEGYMLWCFSIVMENILVAIAALFFALWITSAAGATMAVLGLYSLARLSGELLGIVLSKRAESAQALEIVMQAVTVLTPRLDLFGQTAWLIYGPSDGISYTFLIMQTVLYSGLLLLAAMYDLLKRQF